MRVLIFLRLYKGCFLYIPMSHLDDDKIKFLEKKANPSAQEIQDRIFRKMSADEKMEVAAKLWLLAKALDPDKIDFRLDHGRNRSAPSSH